jgi:glucose/arabinose dehydrogenase
MIRFIFYIYFLVFAGIALSAFGQQPPVGRMTPVQPVDLQPIELEVPAAFSRFLPNRPVLNLPEGYRAKVFYAGPELNKPRFMAWGPDSALFVTDLRGGIFKLPDVDRDGQADAILRIADDVYAHDIKFFRGKLYAAEERRVLELEDLDRDGIYETRRVFIDGIAEGATQPGGGHRTRTIVFDSLGQTLFLSIGSFCNVCREDQRAIIEAYSLDGSNRRTYASGVRNAVGMALQPKTGRLWATNNGSDNQGDNVPPEWIDLVRPNGFYGYPFAYGDGLYFDFTRPQYRDLLPLTRADSLRVQSMVQPAALIQAHSAPMAIEFVPSTWPAPYAGGAFVALRGSWNRRVATGYKVIFLHIDPQNDTTIHAVSDFLTGFLTDSIRSQRWARPVGLAANVQGGLYLTSDDLHACFIKIEAPKPTSRTGQTKTGCRFELLPKSASSSLAWNFSSPNPDQQPVRVRVVAMDGRTVSQVDVSGSHHRAVPFEAPSGIYLACLYTTTGDSLWQRFAWFL